jgi:hypothetical protein
MKNIKKWIIKNPRRGRNTTSKDSNGSKTKTVTVQNSNSSNIKKRMITMVGQRMTILIDEIRERKI